MVKDKKVRKSEKLEAAEFRQFKKWVKSHHTKVDACESLGLSRSNMDRILAIGSAHPFTIAKIREKLSKNN